LQKRQFVFVEGARFAKRIHLEKPQHLAFANERRDADGSHIHFAVKLVVGQFGRRLRVGEQKQRAHFGDVTVVNRANGGNVTLLVIDGMSRTALGTNASRVLLKSITADGAPMVRAASAQIASHTSCKSSCALR
jgi:hypothetical protein